MTVILSTTALIIVGLVFITVSNIAYLLLAMRRKKLSNVYNNIIFRLVGILTYRKDTFARTHAYTFMHTHCVQ